LFFPLAYFLFSANENNEGESFHKKKARTAPQTSASAACHGDIRMMFLPKTPAGGSAASRPQTSLSIQPTSRNDPIILLESSSSDNDENYSSDDEMEGCGGPSYDDEMEGSASPASPKDQKTKQLMQYQCDSHTFATQELAPATEAVCWHACCASDKCTYVSKQKKKRERNRPCEHRDALQM